MDTAEVTISAGVKSSYRWILTEFKPTTTWTTTFESITDTDNYVVAVSALATSIADHITLEQTAGYTVHDVMIRVQVANSSPAVSGKGVVALPKQSIDFAMSGDEATSVTPIAYAINEQIKNLIARIK